MKRPAQRFDQPVESGAARRRRVDGRWYEFQRAVEYVEDGLIAGCLPAPFAALLIARIEKRGGLRSRTAATHV